MKTDTKKIIILLVLNILVFLFFYAFIWPSARITIQ